MEVTDMVVDMVDIVASDPPLPKLILMLKRKLTVTVMAVDTDMEVMVDTVVVMEVTDMVDTVARGLQKKKLKKLNQVALATLNSNGPHSVLLVSKGPITGPVETGTKADTTETLMDTEMGTKADTMETLIDTESETL